MARYSRRRAPARSSRSNYRSRGRSYSTRRASRRTTRTRSRSSGSPRTIKIVVETVPAAAPQPVSLLGMKEAAAPKTAKF